MASTTETLFADYEDHSDFDEPGPPSQAEIDLGHDLSHICVFLNQASRGEHVLWSLDIALGCIRSLARKPRALRPDAEDLVGLLRAAGRAQAGAVMHLPQSYNREHFVAGMDAVMGLLIYWSETDAERALRHRDEIADLWDHVGILRRDLRNVSAREDIRDRAHTRRSQTIAELYAAAHKSGVA